MEKIKEKREVLMSQLLSQVNVDVFCISENYIICVNSELDACQRTTLKVLGAQPTLKNGGTKTRFDFPDNIVLVNDIVDPTQSE